MQHISAQEAANWLQEKSDLKILDVRTPEEREFAKVEPSLLLDQMLVEEILENGETNTPLVLMCHRGGRSIDAAQFFVSRGFQNVYNVEGGIDAWAETVDSSLTRY